MSHLVQTLLFPLHLAVLASLHAVLASSRCVRLIVRLAALALFEEGGPTPAKDLEHGRWSKVPRHLAVALVPGRGGGGTGGLGALRSKVDAVRRLVGRCAELGVRTLSVYDETGMLVRHAALVAHELDLVLLTPPEEAETEGLAALRGRGGAAKGGGGPPSMHPAAVQLADLAQDEADAGSASSSTLVDTPRSSSPAPPPSSPSQPPRNPALNLVSRAAGRPRLARLAATLATQGGQLSSAEIARAIDSLPLAEPDLVLVLGGSYLRLRGFPPWQLRLTEMHHHSWPAWLPPLRVRYAQLRGALDVYGRAEMRLGR